MNLNRARMYRNERLVLGALRRAMRPLSAYQVVGRLRAEGISSPVTVYRALERLARGGFVQRIESLGAFVALPVPAVPGRDSVFAVCRHCGHTSQIDAAFVADHMRQWSLQNGFGVEKMSFELLGCCKSCQDTREAAVR